MDTRNTPAMVIDKIAALLQATAGYRLKDSGD